MATDPAYRPRHADPDGLSGWSVKTALGATVTRIGALPRAYLVWMAVLAICLPIAGYMAIAGDGSKDSGLAVSDVVPDGVETSESASVGRAADFARPAPAPLIGLAANGIPNVALNAYRLAAARMAEAAPACGLDWALLAGIGRVESDHGRRGDAVLNTDGTSTPRIIGPALDGVKWRLVPAPPDGATLAGDSRYAHPLGPMQFLPSAWSDFGVDATGDRRADVFNINDAALSTARYLCAAGGNLKTVLGQKEALAAFNHSARFPTRVLTLAAAYRSGPPVTGAPVGNSRGVVAPLEFIGAPPPVNAVAAPPARPTTAAAPAPPPSSPTSNTAVSSPSTSPTVPTTPTTSAQPTPRTTSATPSPSRTCTQLLRTLRLCH